VDCDPIVCGEVPERESCAFHVHLARCYAEVVSVQTPSAGIPMIGRLESAFWRPGRRT
jgi:hypothetical protein